MIKMVSLEPKRIVFFRIGAIGDIIHTLPLLQLTREIKAKSRIEYVVGSSQVAELLKNYAPYIDKVHVIKHKGVFDKPAKIFKSKEESQLITDLQASPVDEFVYLHTNKIKAQLLNRRFVKAKKLFILDKDHDLSAVANYVTCVYPEFKDDLIENPFRVLKSNTLRALKAQMTNTSTKKNICIVIGVGKERPLRAYPLLYWVEFIEKLLVETDYQINILGGPDEKELSERFEAMLAARSQKLHYNWLGQKPDFSRVQNLIGKTSLLDLALVLKNTDRVFSADTGIVHIAAALDTPCTAIFCETPEKRFAPFTKKLTLLNSYNCDCCFTKHCSNVLSMN